MVVTIQQIAKEAGVSAGTVSRILNGVNKENRPSNAARASYVREVANRLGYRPNVAARSMISGRFHSVAFVNCADPSYDWFSQIMLHGMQRRLEDRGYRLVLNEVASHHLTHPDALPTLFGENAVDAILLHIDSKIPDALEVFQRSHPGRVVLLNEAFARDSVCPDDRMGGRIAARHLIRNGHTSIGYYKLLPENWPMHFSVGERLAGFKEAMKEAGLDASAVHLTGGDFTSPGGDGTAWARRFLEGHPELTAVVCYNMSEYLNMRVAAAQLGRRVPDDLSLVVFHDEPAHSRTDMPADTVIVPFAEVGERAVSMVFDLLDGDEKTLPSRRVPYREFWDASISRMTVIPSDLKS